MISGPEDPLSAIRGPSDFSAPSNGSGKRVTRKGSKGTVIPTKNGFASQSDALMAEAAYSTRQTRSSSSAASASHTASVEIATSKSVPEAETAAVSITKPVEAPPAEQDIRQSTLPAATSATSSSAKSVTIVSSSVPSPSSAVVPSSSSTSLPESLASSNGGRRKPGRVLKGLEAPTDNTPSPPVASESDKANGSSSAASGSQSSAAQSAATCNVSTQTTVHFGGAGGITGFGIRPPPSVRGLAAMLVPRPPPQIEPDISSDEGEDFFSPATAADYAAEVHAKLMGGSDDEAHDDLDAADESDTNQATPHHRADADLSAESDTELQKKRRRAAAGPAANSSSLVASAVASVYSASSTTAGRRAKKRPKRPVWEEEYLGQENYKGGPRHLPMWTMRLPRNYPGREEEPSPAAARRLALEDGSRGVAGGGTSTRPLRSAAVAHHTGPLPLRSIPITANLAPAAPAGGPAQFPAAASPGVPLIPPSPPSFPADKMPQPLLELLPSDPLAHAALITARRLLRRIRFFHFELEVAEVIPLGVTFAPDAPLLVEDMHCIEHAIARGANTSVMLQAVFQPQEWKLVADALTFLGFRCKLNGTNPILEVSEQVVSSFPTIRDSLYTWLHDC